MANVIDVLPEVIGEELYMLQRLCGKLNDEELSRFAMVYRSRRRDPQMVLLATLVGFFGFAGIHRFITDNMLMGILYFFTAGFCFIGTIVDTINYKGVALEYNTKIASEINTYMFQGQPHRGSF